MHPTIDEQLEGVARLVDAASAAVEDPPLAERLVAAAGTLRRLGASWTAVLPFLSHDNAEVVELLARLAPELPSTLAERAAALAGAPVDPLDAGAVHERNVALRGLLAEAVTALPVDASDARAAVARQARARIERDPFSSRSRR